MKKHLIFLMSINVLTSITAASSFASSLDAPILQDGFGVTSVCPFTLASANGKNLFGIQVDFFTSSDCSAGNSGGQIWGTGNAAMHNGSWSLSSESLSAFLACTGIQSIQLTMATNGGGLSNALCMPTTCSSGVYNCGGSGTITMG